MEVKMANETRLSDREAQREVLREAARLANEKPQKHPGHVRTVKVLGDQLVVTVRKTPQ
jgi:hypothetical protein